MNSVHKKVFYFWNKKKIYKNTPSSTRPTDKRLKTRLSFSYVPTSNTHNVTRSTHIFFSAGASCSRTGREHLKVQISQRRCTHVQNVLLYQGVEDDRDEKVEKHGGRIFRAVLVEVHRVTFLICKTKRETTT